MHQCVSVCDELLYFYSCCLTDAGFLLYVDATVLQIDVDLVKPTMIAAVEEQLNLIAHGKADYNAVLEHTIDTFTAKFKYFVEHIQAVDELFEVSFSPLVSSASPISRYCYHVLI